MKTLTAGSTRMRYKIVDIPDTPAIQQAFDLACERLSIDWLSYGFFELTDDPQEGNIVRSTWSGKPVEGEDRSGFMLTMSNSIWIKAGMSLRESIITIGHEVYHCYALWKPVLNSEEAAENFGLRLWHELQAPSAEARINFRKKFREAERRNRKNNPKETKDELFQRLSKQLTINKKNKTNNSDMNESDQQLFEEFQAFKKQKEEQAQQQKQEKKKPTPIRMPQNIEEYQKNGAGPKALREFYRKQKKEEHRIRNNR